MGRTQALYHILCSCTIGRLDFKAISARPASTAQKSAGVTMKSVLGWCRGLRLPYFAILVSGDDFSVYVFHSPFALAPLSHFGGKLLRNVASLIQTNFTAHYVHHKQANNAKRPAENAGSPRKKSLFRPSARARPPKPRKPLILLTFVGSVPKFSCSVNRDTTKNEPLYTEFLQKDEPLCTAWAQKDVSDHYEIRCLHPTATPTHRKKRKRRF